ncbi:MAG: hypothetical protein HZB38_07815 [Planctomycetes bacterium]|nr:hypothetical protein [Planctomycetota bacterium]
MSVSRQAIRAAKLVYVICTPHAQKYGGRRSRVIYIGTTEKGVHRIAASMAHKAIRFLERRGVRSLDVFVITCPPRPGTRSWLLLERDLLIAFKLEYGRVPLANASGKNLGPDRLSGLFHYRRVVSVLRSFA